MHHRVTETQRRNEEKREKSSSTQRARRTRRGSRHRASIACVAIGRHRGLLPPLRRAAVRDRLQVLCASLALFSPKGWSCIAGGRRQATPPGSLCRIVHLLQNVRSPKACSSGGLTTTSPSETCTSLHAPNRSAASRHRSAWADHGFAAPSDFTELFGIVQRTKDHHPRVARRAP